MNKNYIINFHLETGLQIPGMIKAENSEIAINQTVGMLSGEWTNIVDINNNSVRFRSDRIVAIICEEGPE